MEIKIKIEADGLEGAIITLAQVMAGLDLPQTQPKVEVDRSEPAKEVVEKKEKPTEKKEEPAKEDKKEEEAPKITLETVRVKLAELNSAGKGAAVKALIAEFDDSDRPKLSNVSAEDYPALLEKASEL